MNDKDKEDFDKWILSLDWSFCSPAIKTSVVIDMKTSWQAACEYKQKEIDELIKQLKHEHDLYKKHLKIYEDENMKLKHRMELIRLR